MNNVVVAAAHGKPRVDSFYIHSHDYAAHLKHNINRVVIFDIDLHHGQLVRVSSIPLDSLLNLTPHSGNGTQALVWQINEDSYRQKLEQESGAPSSKPGLQVYYGSIHDVLSYPCEVSPGSLEVSFLILIIMLCAGRENGIDPSGICIYSRTTWSAHRECSPTTLLLRTPILGRIVREEIQPNPLESRGIPRTNRWCGGRRPRVCEVGTNLSHLKECASLICAFLFVVAASTPVSTSTNQCHVMDVECLRPSTTDLHLTRGDSPISFLVVVPSASSKAAIATGL